ncbi:MAG: lytic transglycosylase domain-containing protein, partial [Pseudomonadota bacterium]
MGNRLRRTTVATGLILAAAGLAAAQGFRGDTPRGVAPTLVTTPRTASDPYLSPSDAQAVTAILAAAKAGDGARIRASMAGLYDPVARKIAQWALADSAPDSMSFLEADNARRDLAGWPRSVRRQMAAETLLDQAGMAPRQVVAWFGGEAP